MHNWSNRRQNVPRLKRVLCLGCILGMAASILIPGGKALCNRDPWYQDMSFHWAGQYVYVLWQEMVCDGQVYYFTENPVAWYYPDSACTRAQLATLLCKTFALPPVSPRTPSYPDVPTWYTFLPGKPGYVWVEGALAGGIAFVPPGQSFLPENPITREDAVELLIRALDLLELSEAMSDSEVLYLLQRFRDYNQVSLNRRRSMACAIKFGIIDGYTDWTIRPQNSMLRGEAAAVVYRSCLIRAIASLNAFSPDGDGVDDTVTFHLGYLRNRGIREWQMVVRDQNDYEVYRFNPYYAEGYPPTQLVWDGRNNSGNPLPAGQYSYQAWVKDYSNNQFFSVKRPISIVRHSLSAGLSPNSCIDGQSLTVNAVTMPAATGVTATFADGGTLSLTPTSGGTRWSRTLTVGPFLPLGSQNVIVRATFPGAARQQTLSFTRVKNMWIAPWISPNPATAGGTVCLGSTASEGIISLWATLFEETVWLVKDPSGNLWSGDFRIPLTASEGIYPVDFTGSDGADSVSQEVCLTVNQSMHGRLNYILTR